MRRADRTVVHQRQANDELATLPDPIAHRVHTAAMHLYQSLYDRQPDAEPVLPVLQGALGLPEQLEYFRQHLRRDAHARCP